MRSLRRNCVTTKILDPQGPQHPFLHKWNKIFVVSCVMALCLDPVLFYTPLVDTHNHCLSMDKKLTITVCVVRSLIDVFYVFHIFLRFRTGFIAPHFRLGGGGQLVKDSKAIMKRYLQSYFMIDVLSVLPLPQVATAVMIYVERVPVKIHPLILLITAQNLVRFLRIVPLLKEVTKTSGIITEAAWGGAVLNFCLYMLASHAIGSFWYMASIERAKRCWLEACAYNRCNVDSLYCRGGHHGGSNSHLIFSACSPFQPGKSDFDYGIYANALRLQLDRNFFRRFFYCFAWGLRNLSSLGTNLETSNNHTWENLFVVIISITGLILFSFLASNIQRFLQSLTVRADEMRVKLRDREQWMSRTMLPQTLRSRVRQHHQYIWVKNRGVNEESLISDLPLDLRRDIKIHQCSRLLRRVPMFDKMDQQLIEALCCCLKRIFYTVDTIIVREGYPVDQMLFIEMGKILATSTTNLVGSDSLNMITLKAGEFCGEELVMWAMDPDSSSSLPISTRTLRAVDNVEAFSLTRDDLRFVVSQFRYVEGQQFDHIVRLNSQQWRSWGACIIQAAWRRYRRRKMERSLKEAEDRVHDVVVSVEEGTHQALVPPFTLQDFICYQNEITSTSQTWSHYRDSS